MQSQSIPVSRYAIYVLVRTDIALPQQLVQAAHAAAEAGRAYYRAEHGIASAVLLAVPDRESLLLASARLAARDVAHQVFFEPDNGMGESALATGPLQGAARRALAGYPLWGAGSKRGGGGQAARDLLSDGYPARHPA